MQRRYTIERSYLAIHITHELIELSSITGSHGIRSSEDGVRPAAFNLPPPSDIENKSNYRLSRAEPIP